MQINKNCNGPYDEGFDSPFAEVISRWLVLQTKSRRLVLTTDSYYVVGSIVTKIIKTEGFFVLEDVKAQHIISQELIELAVNGDMTMYASVQYLARTLAQEMRKPRGDLRSEE